MGVLSQRRGITHVLPMKEASKVSKKTPAQQKGRTVDHLPNQMAAIGMHHSVPCVELEGEDDGKSGSEF